MLDALARKVALELVSNTDLAAKLADYLKKTDIVQTESTDTNKVPSSAYLKQVKDNIDSNLAKTVENMNQSYRLRLYWDNDNGLIQVYVGSTYKGNLKFTP